MNVKVSIIVPCYNSEKYISKCLESITNQTYKNIEIICVNDGTTDSTLSILKEYSDNDDRIKVIDKKNSGLSGARNAAKRHCTGEYISFVDSDDWISRNYIEAALEVATEKVIGISKLNKCPGGRVKVNERYNKKNMYKKCRIGSCGKVYPLSKWTTPFKDGLIFEDEAHTPELYSGFNEAKRFNGIYYYRRDNMNSITRTKWEKETYLKTLNVIKDKFDYKYADIRIIYFSLKVYKEFPEDYKKLLRTKQFKRIIKKYYSPKILILRTMLLLGMKKTIRKLI